LLTLQPGQLGTQFLDPRAVQRYPLAVHIDHVRTACDPLEDGTDTGSEIEASLDVTVTMDGILLM
jgi:hypothetical protein